MVLFFQFSMISWKQKKFSWCPFQFSTRLHRSYWQDVILSQTLIIERSQRAHHIFALNLHKTYMWIWVDLDISRTSFSKQLVSAEINSFDENKQNQRSVKAFPSSFISFWNLYIIMRWRRTRNESSGSLRKAHNCKCEIAWSRDPPQYPPHKLDRSLVWGPTSYSSWG